MPPAPLAIDAILGLILVELVVLSVWLARRGQRELVPALACFLLSGALLALAVRVALTSTDPAPLVLGLMALSFPAHLATLWFVWRQVSRS